MLLDYVCAAVIGLLSLFSFLAYFLQPNQSQSADRPVIDRFPFAMHFVNYIRISNLVFGAGALLSTHPIFLRLLPPGLTQWVGLSACVLGFVVFYFGKKGLGQNYSDCSDSRLPESVVNTGVYRWIRHPIYSGNLIMLVGGLLMTGSLWLVINLVGLYLIYLRATSIEERAITKFYPKYEEYQQITGRFLPKVF